MKKSLRRVLPVLALCFVAFAKKEPGFTVRFYTETTSTETNTFAVPVQLQNPPRKSFISTIPNISEHDIYAIYPFQATDGTIGCVFLLDDHGKDMLDTLSIEKRGTSLIALVNVRQVIDMLIDRRIPDGILVIPHGMTVEEGLLLKKTFKVINMPPATPPAKQ